MQTQQKTYTLLPLALCLLSLMLVSCDLFGGDSQAQKQLVKAPLNKQTYAVPIIGATDFDTLDPALAHDPASTSAVQMLYTGLVQLNEKLEVVPQLAASWKQESDGVTWTFHLKPKLQFNDGTALTSQDVVYSIERAVLPGTKSTVAPIYLGLINHVDQLLAGKITTLIGDSLQAPDPQTVVIVTRKKAAYFLQMLTSPCSYVVEKSLVSKYNDKFTDHLNEGGGAGPFKPSTVYAHNGSIDLVPNTHYYSKKPQLQHVTFTFYRQAEEAYQDYQDKKLDVSSVPFADIANEHKNKELHRVPQAWINYYAMNYLAKPFNNIHIRQAFALAVNKTAIVKNVWKDTLIPTNHIVPEGIRGYNANLVGPDDSKSLTGNPRKAQELFQQGLREEGFASVNDMPAVTLTYVTGVTNFDQEVEQLVKQWQQVLKVTVQPDPVDETTLLDKVTAATGNPDGIQMWGLAWVGEYPDPQDWLSLQFGKGTPNNNMNYGQNSSKTAAQQQEVQQKLENADSQDSAVQRVQAYQQAEQQIVKDVGWLPMEQVTSNFLRTTSIVGIVDNAQNLIPPDAWANIYRVQ